MAFTRGLDEKYPNTSVHRDILSRSGLPELRVPAMVDQMLSITK
jgi:hypothetical protein